MTGTPKESNFTNQYVMKKPFELWQAFITTVLLIGSITGAFVNLTNKIERQQIRLEYLESERQDYKNSFKEINSKLTEILIELKNKEDRPLK